VIFTSRGPEPSRAARLLELLTEATSDIATSQRTPVSVPQLHLRLPSSDVMQPVFSLQAGRMAQSSERAPRDSIAFCEACLGHNRERYYRQSLHIHYRMVPLGDARNHPTPDAELPALSAGVVMKMGEGAAGLGCRVWARTVGRSALVSRTRANPFER